MAFQTIPRDGSIFDNKTTDCLNAEISALDNTIDGYKVEDLRYNKRVFAAPLIDKDLSSSDASFCIERLFCLRLNVFINKNYDNEWKKVGRLPVSIPTEWTATLTSDKGWTYYAKIEEDVLYITGSSDKASTDLPDDQVVICNDFIIPTNKLLEKL